MLRPFLLVGVGGSGGKTLRAIRESLRLKLLQHHWTKGWPEGWQLIHVDSPTKQDGEDFPAPFLPSENYLSLVPRGITYKQVFNSISSKAETRFKPEIQRPLPHGDEVKIPIKDGAGAFRAIGRAIAANALSDVQSKAKSAITKLNSTSARESLSALTSHLGLDSEDLDQQQPDPIVIVVSSIAGGSGAGMFLDVTEAVKSAIGGQPWGDAVFGVLYAPDVFHGVKIDGMDAIAPNALGAMAETMSGLWTNSLSESTDSLYKSHGVMTANTNAYNLGPKMNYIVGRKNSQVDFATQSGVYKATATSLAAWMTDPSIQDDMTAYAMTNLESRAVGFPDNSGLKRNTKDIPPFSSLGFARVTMGTEFFEEYAAERLAKEALETMMKKHLESDPEMSEKTDQQWKMHFADLHEGRFFADSGVYEQTEENNQLIEALIPDTSVLQSKLKSSVASMVQQGMPKEGHSFDNWVLKICNAYEVNLPGLLDELTQLRHEKVRLWVEAIPDKVLRLVSLTISQQGLPVTVELLNRLIIQCKDASQELQDERARHIADSGRLQNLVSQAMGAAANNSSISPQHPTVAQAMHQVEMAFYWRSMADLKEEGSKILKDFSKNFLEPLHKEIDGGFTTLRDGILKEKLLDGRKNTYVEWPSFKQTMVPSKFTPAPNQRLLIDHKSFPKTFDDLVTKTVNDSKIDAKRAVIDQLIMGAYASEEVNSLHESRRWKIIELTQPWVPSERSHQLREGAPQQANFEFLTDHMGYIDRARLWLDIPGRVFRVFLDQTISTFISNRGDRMIQEKNREKFVQEFTSALASASPLVEINQALMSQVHGMKGNSISALFSEIPVDLDDPLFAPLKQALVSLGYWDDSNSEKWFVGAGKGARQRTIDIFTQLNVPIQPIVMGSVMGPIAQTWSKMRSDKESRTGFMKWRRGRSLPEAIPAHPEIWNQMLKGWYVMRLLNMFQIEEKNESYEEKGPKVSIWVNSNLTYSSFPYPLFSSEIAKVGDLPAVVLESLTAALANCYEETTLLPLEPYKRLFSLGDVDSESSVLVDWVRSGKLSQGAPTPVSDRAGTVEQSFEERRETCLLWIKNEIEQFRDKNISSMRENDDFRKFPLVWEIREQVIDALSEIGLSIGKITTEDTL
jgi:hypothetical protein